MKKIQGAISKEHWNLVKLSHESRYGDFLLVEADEWLLHTKNLLSRDRDQIYFRISSTKRSDIFLFYLSNADEREPISLITSKNKFGPISFF